MALEHLARATSPASSGRASPVPRTLRRGADHGALKKDKSYRKYASNIERALSLFDPTQQEWADYISFLGRLLKAVQVHPEEVHAIPHSSLIATRLSQCLNPALPAGVHQKALEVYGCIFQILGKHALSRDIHIFFPGLASVLSFASLTVRPLFLSLFESFILKLEPRAVRPALKSMILSLLPGLEDETSEDFERMFNALDRLGRVVRERDEDVVANESDCASHFWQSLFLATMTNAPRRQGALAYLVRRLPKFAASTEKRSGPEADSNNILSPEAQVAISPEPGLLVRCFAAGLSDSQPLIQRGFLDLLVSRLPLDSPVLQEKVNRDDMDRLVASAAGVVARKDMSLNRRLWSWFLGPDLTASAENDTDDVEQDGNPSSSAAFFSRFGLQPLSRTMLAMIKTESAKPTERARPFRICLSLMDRWEVGGLVVPIIFIPSLQSIEKYGRTATSEELAEVLKSASLFFDGVEAGLIWGKLLELAQSALKPASIAGDEQLGKLQLIRFVLSRFNVRDEEMVLYHTPLLIIALLALVLQYDAQGHDSRFYNVTIVFKTLEIVEFLVQQMPERALRTQNREVTRKPSVLQPKDLLALIEIFYTKSQGNLEASSMPLNASELAFHAVRLSGALFQSTITQSAPSNRLDVTSRILSSLLEKASATNALNKEIVTESFSVALHSSLPLRTSEHQSFRHLSSITAVLTSLQTSVPGETFFNASEIPQLVHKLVQGLWAFLSPWKPKYHVEAVRCLWQLHAMSANARLVEASITTLVVTPGTDGHIEPEATRRFCVVWSHSAADQVSSSGRAGRPLSRRGSALLTEVDQGVAGLHALLTRPLMHVLETLSSDQSDVFTVVRAWLQEPMTLYQVIDIVTSHLRGLNSFQRNTSALEAAPTVSASKTGTSVTSDIKRCLYFVNLLHDILRASSQEAWLPLVRNTTTSLEGNSASADQIPMQILLIQIAMRSLALTSSRFSGNELIAAQDLQRVAIDILLLMLTGPHAENLRHNEFELPLMTLLQGSSPSLQSRLLRVIVAALKLRYADLSKNENEEARPSRDLAATRKRGSLSKDDAPEDKDRGVLSPPPLLTECLKVGFTSPSSRLILDEWVQFLIEVLPLFEDTIFQNLLPLVTSFRSQIEEIFEQLRLTYKNPATDAIISPESTLISLMNGLEQILKKAHDKLVTQEAFNAPTKTPEQQQGLFGNVIGGMFASDTAHPQRAPTANSRLTVLLCFKDVVTTCFSIWSWNGYTSTASRQDSSSLATFGYASLRLRNRSRKLLENLFATETLECLETLVAIWCESSEAETRAAAVLGLLNVLDGTKPKHAIPAILNAIYSRTSPAALEPAAVSSLTSELIDSDLVCFLVEYVSSLEDDAMVEIWPDCLSFLKDLLSNPMPQRQILPMLLQFVSQLAQKVDNTNFGEQRRMRRELGDLFMRLLTATFTTRTAGYVQEASADKPGQSQSASAIRLAKASDIVAILADVVPQFPLILVENDRIGNAVTAISTSVIAPTVRAKAYPANVSLRFLDLLYRLGRPGQSSKIWQKDIAEAFNDARFFSFSAKDLQSQWLPILQQWTLSDKDRMQELLSRFTAPASAGIMFGVGATSARNEADRKTQLNLRRVALLLLSGLEDAFVPSFASMQEKLIELLTATPSSSPSSVTRAELFMVFRALVLRTSSVPLAPLWPILNAELISVISAILPDDENYDKYNNTSIMQACKLLDLLVALDPEEFQLHEWLYVTDTIDAVYRSPGTEPTALADAVAECLASINPSTPVRAGAILDAKAQPGQLIFSTILSSVGDATGLPVENGQIQWDKVKKADLAVRVLRPFFEQLSLWAFEERYAGVGTEALKEECVRDLIGDLCGVGTVKGE